MLRLYSSSCFKCAFQRYNSYHECFIHSSSCTYRAEKLRNVFQLRKFDRKKLKTSPQSRSLELSPFRHGKDVFIEEGERFKTSKLRTERFQASAQPQSSESVLFTMSTRASYSSHDENKDFIRRTATKQIRKGPPWSPKEVSSMTEKKKNSHNFLGEAVVGETRQFETIKFQTNQKQSSDKRTFPDVFNERNLFESSEIDVKPFETSPQSSTSDSVLFSEPVKTSNDFSSEKKDSKTSEFETNQFEMRLPPHTSEPREFTINKPIVYDFLDEENDDFKPCEVQRKQSQMSAQSRSSDSVLFTIDETVSNDFPEEEENNERSNVERKPFERSVQSSTESKQASYNVFEEDLEPREGRTKHLKIGLQSPSSESRESARSRIASNAEPMFATVEDVLNYLASNANIDVGLYASIFETIDVLLKRGKIKLSARELCRRREIENLSRNVKKNLGALSVEDAIVIVKVLTNLGISINSILGYDLLNMLLKKMNKLELKSLLFLNRVVASQSSAASNPVFSAFKIAAPMVFETRIKSFVEECDVWTLIRAYTFALSHESISEETRQMLVDKLVERIDEEKPVRAYRIMKWLPRVNRNLCEFPPLYRKLRDKMAEGFAESSSETIARIVSHFVDNYSRIHGKTFSDVDFVKQGIDHLIRKNSHLSSEDADSLLRKLNYVNYCCPELLNYMDERFAKSHFVTLNELSSYVHSCAINMHKPRHWNSYEDKMFALADSLETIPWLGLVMDLLVLQSCPREFVARCFDRALFDQGSLRGYFRKKMILRLQRIHEMVKLFPTSDYSGPFLPDHLVEEAVNLQRKRKNYDQINYSLLQGLGGQEYVLNGVRTELGQVVDFLVVKCEGKMYPVNPTKITGICNLSYESLDLPAESCPIAVMSLGVGAFLNCDGSRLIGSYQIRSRCLEAKGISPTPFPYLQWNNLPSAEKVTYLMNKINSTFSHHVISRRTDERS